MCSGEGHAPGCACVQCSENQAAEKAFALAGYGVPNGGSGDPLIGGRAWAGDALTYGFPSAAAVYDTDVLAPGLQYGEGEAADGFQPLTASQRRAAEYAIDQIAAVSGLEVSRDDADADIRLAQSALPASAWGYYPGDDAESGDVWFGTQHGYYDNPARGGYAWHAFLHELGHAVGLKHGHERGAIGAGGS